MFFPFCCFDGKMKERLRGEGKGREGRRETLVVDEQCEVSKRFGSVEKRKGR